MKQVKSLGAGDLWCPYLSYNWSYLHQTFLNGVSYNVYTLERLVLVHTSVPCEPCNIWLPMFWGFFRTKFVYGIKYLRYLSEKNCNFQWILHYSPQHLKKTTFYFLKVHRYSVKRNTCNFLNNPAQWPHSSSIWATIFQFWSKQPTSIV